MRKEHTLKAHNYKALKRIFGNTECIKGQWNAIHILYWLFAIVRVITSMTRTSSKSEKVIIHTKFWSDHLANLGVDGRIIL
jgi:hypothetical protein